MWDEYRLKVAAAGGIKAVVAAMKTHACVADVQLVGCSALRNLSAPGVNEKRVAAAGGIDAVVAAMRAHATAT